MLRMLNIQVKVEFNPCINIEPSTEIGHDDNVLGRINSRQRELFVLAKQLKIIADNSFEASNGADANGMKKLLEAKAHELSEKSGSIMKTFIIDVMDAYNLWGSYGNIDIGIRRGWIVVWTKTEEEEDASHVIEMSLN